MAQGFFITFEGGEGVGKTTQIKHLEKHLIVAGHDVLVTREPGGTLSAEAVRDLIFHSDFDGGWSVEAETLMMFAARSMHIRDVIAPALVAGKIILCDRYHDSTRVYQGVVKNAGMDFIKILEQKIIGAYIPNLTIMLDLPADVAMARVKSRGAENNNDRGSLDFYNKLRQGFLDIAKAEPTRCEVIDANRTPEIIAKDIAAFVRERLAA